MKGRFPMASHKTCRRRFIQRFIACSAWLIPEPLPVSTKSRPAALTFDPIRQRIELAFDWQDWFVVAVDAVDVDAIMASNVLRVTSSRAGGRQRGRDAAIEAVLHHGWEFRHAAASLLLVGVRPYSWRFADLAAARRVVLSQGPATHVCVYAVYPEPNLRADEVEITLVAGWNGNADAAGAVRS